ncbi:hypothetical protein LSTR_LSTR009631 [Laodelphax striatellus]|uniref:Uncharacterized protein n=1 Tax=Laodelphax striatellus TaxID=195883 RepID=A0A482WNA3_LAOST|nr:hypothetical protein LSTR_LSTR009631 [Laodelphax striatellus]
MKFLCLVLGTFLVVMTINSAGADKFDFDTFTSGDSISADDITALMENKKYEPFDENWPDENKRDFILDVLSDMVNTNGSIQRKEFDNGLKAELERRYKLRSNSGLTFFPRHESENSE